MGRNAARACLSWENRTILFCGSDQLYQQHRWNDYSTIDVVVALRPAEAWAARSKPAAKLQNAWAAGVPAILSPESQYRHLRRSSLDYIEARSAADVLAAVDRLRADPDLYDAMVRNGLERGREFHTDRIVRRWREVLWDDIPRRAGRLSHRVFGGSRRWRAFARRLQDDFQHIVEWQHREIQRLGNRPDQDGNHESASGARNSRLSIGALSDAFAAVSSAARGGHR